MSSWDTEDPCEVGKLTTYVLELRNERTSPYTNVQVKNNIPDETEFVSARGPTEHKVNGKKIEFAPIGLLQPGQKVVYKITCKAIKPGDAINYAILTYKEFSKPIVDEEGTSFLQKK